MLHLGHCHRNNRKWIAWRCVTGGGVADSSPLERASSSSELPGEGTNFACPGLHLFDPAHFASVVPKRMGGWSF
jgi:hypothetical protein